MDRCGQSERSCCTIFFYNCRRHAKDALLKWIEAAISSELNNLFDGQVSLDCSRLLRSPVPSSELRHLWNRQGLRGVLEVFRVLRVVVSDESAV